MANGIVFPSRTPVFAKSVPLPYFTTDDWHVPPVLENLIQVTPKGHSSIPWFQFVATPISRAYDWLVTQYSMLVPPGPQPPNPGFKRGRVIPSYLYNMPTNYPQTRSF